MKHLIFGAILALGLGNVYASDKGNGGDGLLINGKIYVLDLVEAGVEDAPYFDLSIPLDPVIKSAVRELKLAGTPSDLLIRKLSEIKRAFAPMGVAMAQTLGLFDWRLVNSALMDIRDENSVLSRKNLMQLAIRRGNIIFIDRSLWAKLGEKQKVALLIHELVYAMMETKEACQGPCNDLNDFYSTQSSEQARKIVGFMFSPSLKSTGPEYLFESANKGTGLHDVVYVNNELYKVKNVSGNRAGRINFTSELIEKSDIYCLYNNAEPLEFTITFEKTKMELFEYKMNASGDQSLYSRVPWLNDGEAVFDRSYRIEQGAKDCEAQLKRIMELRDVN